MGGACCVFDIIYDFREYDDGRLEPMTVSRSEGGRLINKIEVVEVNLREPST